MSSGTWLCAQVLGNDVTIDRAEGVEEATEILARLVQPGDEVLVKASNSIGLAKLVERMAGGLQMADAGEGARR